MTRRTTDMDKLKATIRPTDIVLAVLLSGLGVWLMVENINAHDVDVTIDSHSWLLVPVFLAATLPVLFRRVNLLAVTLVSAAALAVHDTAFDWVVRCGAGLPLAFVLAYSAGRLIDCRRQSATILALSVGVQALVLVRDSAAGLGILPVTAGLGIVAWGVGWFVRSRLAKRTVTSPVTSQPIAARV